MKALFLNFLAFFLLSGCGKGFKKEEDSSVSPQVENPSDPYTVNQDYLIHLNNHRIRKGLRPLTYSPFIEEEALRHSRSMAFYTSSFGHMGLSRRCRRIASLLGPTKRCGEVVAMGQKSAKEAMISWLNSVDHREELEDPNYTHTAIAGYKNSIGTYYWTQIFIEK